MSVLKGLAKSKVESNQQHKMTASYLLHNLHPALLPLHAGRLTKSKRALAWVNSTAMAGPPKKRQKRSEREDGSMPQKKYYRQRAHANPFSDHDLT